jgi:hypothetical protein
MVLKYTIYIVYIYIICIYIIYVYIIYVYIVWPLSYHCDLQSP